MSDYRFQVVSHNGIDCLHVMTEAQDDIAHAYIPLDMIQRSAMEYAQKKHVEIELSPAAKEWAAQFDEAVEIACGYRKPMQKEGE